MDIVQHPRYIDMDKCIACGLCAEKCPKKVDDEYDEALGKRKAVFVKYAQAVPLKYSIDAENCIYLTRGKCGNCKKVCPTGAINYEDQEKDISLNVGSVIISSGCKPYDPAEHDVYGYKTSKNIVTSLEFERILSSAGPYEGHLVRPSDKKEPQKIAWLQCVGSRDNHLGSNGYCSSVCCTYAVKEAMLAKEHSHDPLDTAIFYMDIRTHGKDYEHFYNRGKDESGIRFVKSKITNIVPDPDTGLQLINYIDETGTRQKEAFDIVVLSVGLCIGKEVIDLADKMDISLDHYNFVTTNSFEPVKTSRPGIFICGAFEAPKDIPSSVIESSAAAGMAGINLRDARWSLTKTKEIPEEINITGEPPRIGVFVCRCGTNIAGEVDVPAVVQMAKKLPYVEYADENMFSCSQDTQDAITNIIKEKKLNRVVIAACTPKTHEGLFQETLTNAGINKYLFDMANIRNQCSWIHAKEKDKATQKAKDLVRMTTAKVALHESLTEPTLDIDQSGLVIGGGVAGIVAAKTLADQGYHTHLVEKEDKLGGQANHLYQTWQGEDIQTHLSSMIKSIEKDKLIDIHLNTEITDVDGFVGNFETHVNKNGDNETLKHGITIIATGASELTPEVHLYGEDDRVVTGTELDRKFLNNDEGLNSIGTAVFIQCVGSRIPERPYCSKVCCTQSIRNALKLKSLNPEMNVFVLYRDMRPFGLREDLYTEARTKGIQFIKFDFEKELEVTAKKDQLQILFSDTSLRRKMEIKTDLVVLAASIVPEKENKLAAMYKISQNADGFFMEAHAKLKPVDCATDGVFLCGLAHAPKPIDESISQAQAAATRAVTLLAKKTMNMDGTVALVNQEKCSSCGVCVSVCPFSAPSFTREGRFAGKAEINPVLCKGCGLCVASCRSGALHLKGFDNNQIFAQIFALNDTVASEDEIQSDNENGDTKVEEKDAANAAV
ncbi:MAG: heterodisulfide reductase [Deltaproteobacteria bacterium]|nr:MAG: heterodisulfide reductase [Deltaproteobacteria bacterium]